jgi:hypothetical protein
MLMLYESMRRFEVAGEKLLDVHWGDVGATGCSQPEQMGWSQPE